MAEPVSLEQLIKFIQDNDSESFKFHIGSLPKNVADLTDKLNTKEKEKAVRWCKDTKKYLIHMLFMTVTVVDSIQFLIDERRYKALDLRDLEGRTWLHIAVLYERPENILKFLVNDLAVDPTLCDKDNMTALHFACQKLNHVSGELDLIIKHSNQLTFASKDNVTPLELACGDSKKIEDIQRISKGQLSNILMSIDKITNGLPPTEDYYHNISLSKHDFWVPLLHKNEKYRLIHIMKKDTRFSEKCKLSSEDIIKILRSCHENGQGILTHVKEKFLKDNKNIDCLTIFTGLSGLKKCSKKNVTGQLFHETAMFLALITGRFELVPPLLQYCQFEIIPYALIICLICQRFRLIQFPSQVLENISQLKYFCESYAIEVLNRTTIRDSTKNRNSIHNFLTKFKYMNHKIFDLAYSAKCTKFLSSPPCREVFRCTWRNSKISCPLVKFWTHAIAHLSFLGLFTYILVFSLFVSISIPEIICYLYSFGYFVEELRQIFTLKMKGLWHLYFKDASNIIDIGALSFMLVGFILRVIFYYVYIFSAFKFDKIALDNYLFVGRLPLCLSFILFAMRIIYFGSISQTWGPKLKMMGKMMVEDLLPLICIFIVFIFAFGVVFQALLYPSSMGHGVLRNKTINVIVDIFRRSTFSIFDAQYTINDMQESINDNGKVAVYFLLLLFFVIVNVMLMNLLIALFSYTVTQIIETSNEAWNANRYKTIMEHRNKSNCPPPMNIIEILIVLIKKISQKIRKIKKNKPNNTGVNDCPNKENIRLTKIDKEMTKSEKEIEFKFFPFLILQAFAMRDCRYKLEQTKADEAYYRQIEFKLLETRLMEKIQQIKS